MGFKKFSSFSIKNILPILIFMGTVFQLSSPRAATVQLALLRLFLPVVKFNPDDRSEFHIFFFTVMA